MLSSVGTAQSLHSPPPTIDLHPVFAALHCPAHRLDAVIQSHPPTRSLRRPTSVTQLSHCITPPPIGTYGWSFCQPPNRFPPTQPHPSYAVHSRLSIPVDLSVREEREREREEESENASERSHASTPHTNHTQSHSLTATTDHTSLTAQRLTHSGESRGAPLLRHIWCRGGVLF